MDVVRLAAWSVALLLAGVALFQPGLAGGAPWGDMSYGGRAETVIGILPGSYRGMSGAAVVIRLPAAWIVLARSGVVPGRCAEDSCAVPPGCSSDTSCSIPS